MWDLNVLFPDNCLFSLYSFTERPTDLRHCYIFFLSYRKLPKLPDVTPFSVSQIQSYTNFSKSLILHGEYFPVSKTLYTRGKKTNNIIFFLLRETTNFPSRCIWPRPPTSLQ